MTRRERLERKVERRREWATGRRARAEQTYAATEPYRSDHAFNTQPGHIPLRARVIRTIDRAHEDLAMAQHHEAKADGLERQLDRSVFSDDTDAVEQLEARIAERERECERVKALNAAIRREMKAGLTEGWIDRVGATESERQAILNNAKVWGSPVFPGYVLRNLRASVATDWERIEAIQDRRGRSERAEAAGGVVVEGEAWVRVTFAEKPAREVLDALKTAGFRWGGGSWVGERAKLPVGVVQAPQKEG